MMQGIALHAAHTWIILFMCQIIVRLFQRIDGIMQATTTIRMDITMFGMVHILTDIQPQLHDDLLGPSDFFERTLLIAPHFPIVARAMGNQPFCLMQICLCMGIKRMTTWLVRTCRDGSNYG